MIAGRRRGLAEASISRAARLLGSECLASPRFASQFSTDGYAGAAPIPRGVRPRAVRDPSARGFFQTAKETVMDPVLAQLYIVVILGLATGEIAEWVETA